MHERHENTILDKAKRQQRDLRKRIVDGDGIIAKTKNVSAHVRPSRIEIRFKPYETSKHKRELFCTHTTSDALEKLKSFTAELEEIIEQLGEIETGKPSD